VSHVLRHIIISSQCIGEPRPENWQCAQIKSSGGLTFRRQLLDLKPSNSAAVLITNNIARVLDVNRQTTTGTSHVTFHFTTRQRKAWASARSSSQRASTTSSVKYSHRFTRSFGRTSRVKDLSEFEILAQAPAPNPVRKVWKASMRASS
jgi:hypothetical protein